MNKFTNTISRTPCDNLVNGQNMEGKPSGIDIKLARKQHKDYVELLGKIGMETYLIPEDNTFPDSTFVEDAALCADKCAVITNPGHPTRNGEKTEMAAHIAQFYPVEDIHYIQSPGTMDAGDVMMVDDTFYVGITSRTNQAGIDQLAAIYKPYGYKVVAVKIDAGLHLKSSVSYLEHNNLLIEETFNDYLKKTGNTVFNHFNKIIIPKKYGYATNSIWINEHILVPAEFPEVLEQLKTELKGKSENNKDYTFHACATSEIAKVDGGLSCTSLRFKAPCCGECKGCC